MIEHLELKNFTVFNSLELDLSPRINVIIGENGTGKTHLLKAAYGLCSGVPLKNKPESSEDELKAALTAKLLRIFMPLEEKLGKLHHRGATGKACLQARFAKGHRIAATFSRKSKTLAIQERANHEQSQAGAVFIPTKEALSLAKGMANKSHDRKTLELIFDAAYLDIAAALMEEGHEDVESKVSLDPRFNAIIPQLTNLIGGRYRWENGDFCFESGSYAEKVNTKRSKSRAAQMYQDSTTTRFVRSRGPLFSSEMTAEGFRKIGILHRILSNGILNPGSIGPLFWDEPESNMNPRMMEPLVCVLLELSRNGQQIILATHDYVLLKWFDLLMDKGKEDHVRFHTLYRDIQSGEVKIDSTDDYREIERNPISEAFNHLTIAHAKSRLEEVGNA